jgi:hypothetical protein
MGISRTCKLESKTPCMLIIDLQNNGFFPQKKEKGNK